MLRRRAEPGVKCAALNLLASAVEGMEERDPNVMAVQLDALKIAASCAKDRYNDPSVKCAFEPGVSSLSCTPPCPPTCLSHAFSCALPVVTALERDRARACARR